MAYEDRLEPLSFAVRPRVVLKYTGQLGLALAALTLVPLGVALGYEDWPMAWRLALVVALLTVAGVPLGRLRSPRTIQTNEALVVTALAFLVAPLAMSWPMAATGIPYLDALFEAVSGVTTTGLTTLASVAERPPAFLFTRAWMQWYGGLGFVVLSLALLIGPGVAARRLANISGEGEDLIGNTRGHARRVLAVYLAFTVAGIALLWALGLAPFAAVVHTLAAVSTGGYSSFDGSLAGLGLSTQWAVTLLSLAGAVALSTWYRAARGGPAALANDLQLRALLLAGLAVTMLLALFMLRSGQPWSEVVRHAPLLALSAQTTTGFASLDVGALDPAARITLAGSMLVGGGVGSTAGGFKILRLLILLRLLQILLHRTRLVEHAVVEYRLGETRIEPEEGLRALLVVVLYIGVVALSWLPFAAAGYDPLNALFEVVSATATVGLSTGITALELDPWLKGVLCLDMLLGRLEVLALLVVLYPRTWFGRRND